MKEELYNSIKHVANKINKLYKNLIIEEHVRTIVQEALQEPIVTINLLQKSTIVYIESTFRALDNLKVEVQRLTSYIASIITSTSLLLYIPIILQYAITTILSYVSTTRLTILTCSTTTLSFEEDPIKRYLFEDKTPRASNLQDSIGQGSTKDKYIVSAISTIQKKEGQGTRKYNTVYRYPLQVNLFE